MHYTGLVIHIMNNEKIFIACSEIIDHLHRIYSSAFYGIELRYNDINTNRALHTAHKAILHVILLHEGVKRIPGLCTWDSNHLACESIGINIFRQLQAKRVFNFYLSIIKSENRSMMSLKYYFSYNSCISKNIVEIFFD